MAAPLLPDFPALNHSDEVLPIGASRAEWLAIRRTGIGSSDVSALLDFSQYRGPRDVWEDKTGAIPLLATADAPSEAARWGNLLEPVVRDEFASRVGLSIQLVGTHRSREWPWMLANVDGITSDGGVYEGKTCNQWKAGEWDDDQVPDHAELQAQHGMAVTGLGHAWIAGLIGGQHLAYKRVERDDELIAILVEQERQFWHDHVLTGTPPALGGSEAAEAWVRERFPVADDNEDAVVLTEDEARELRDRYQAKKDAAKSAEVAFKSVQNEIREVLGTAGMAVCGKRTVATYRNNGTFASKRFTEDHPEVADRYRKTVTVLDAEALRTAEPALYARYRARTLRIS